MRTVVPPSRPARRVLGGLGLALAVALTGITTSTVPATAAPDGRAASPRAVAVPGPVPPPPPGAPGPAAPMEAPVAPVPPGAGDGGPQRWAPPLAGSTHAVVVADGTARLDSGRDAGSAPASLRGIGRFGLLELGAHRFGTEVNRLDVRVDTVVPPGSEVAADVRGQGADGRWSEWTPAVPGAPAVLDEPTRTVELRLVLTAPPSGPGPEVRGVEVVADRIDTGPRVLTPRASYRVFATREGLVGGTTANGHRIVPNDQFVALPSRRGLSPRGRGDYSVRVCTDARRCATVPVWDVGPWNTTDDYWNPGNVRQSWRDLPIGLPQAQAAFERRYNDGEDGFGRRVKNPAGIDLADGTFYGLGLRDNAWVTVDYLWTSRAGIAGRAVAPAGPLPVRSVPATTGQDLGVVGDGAQVALDCQAPGMPISGTQGDTDMWYRIAPGEFIPAAFVEGSAPVPPCTG